jgi:hypothetical protein
MPEPITCMSCGVKASLILVMGHDLVNVIFQSRHLNKIIVGLEMSSPFRDLHREDRENFIMSANRAIGNFLIHEERL